ncbi:MAG: hypothetical protein AB1650_03735 [Candidatus Omnitrophota bacterium]
MFKCPYCYEALETKSSRRCPHCLQFIIDEILDIPYPSVEKKDCIFCGKKIVKEAIFCKHCRKWLDELNKTIEDVDWGI